MVTLTWMALGLAAGLIVHVIDGSRVKGGVLGTMLTGILGALVGGLLTNIIFGVTVTGFNLGSIAIAVAGGLFLAVLERLIFRDQGYLGTLDDYLTYRQVGALGGRREYKKTEYMLPKGTQVKLPNGVEFQTTTESSLEYEEVSK
jgi:uncharacterized membrane protein YeaQ/YmgE (transglycosylase-associated protein family)